MKLLKYSNSWEYDIYTIEDKPVTDLKKVSINGTEYDVTSAQVGVSYNDMGHNYVSTSTHYYVEALVFGKELMRFDLNRVKSKIYAIDYTLKG